MNKKLHLYLLLIMFCFSFPVIGATEKIYHLEPIVISADRLSQPINQVTSSVTIISREDLAKENALRADEVLRGMPGIMVHSVGSIGEGFNVQLRGTDRNETLVLIDGMKVNSPWYGAYREWGHTELADIGRIEVIRGTQSDLYGSEAVGGIVHLFTKKGKGAPYSTITLGGGNFNTWRESLETAAGGKKNYLFSIAQTNSHGQIRPRCLSGYKYNRPTGLGAQQ